MKQNEIERKIIGEIVEYLKSEQINLTTNNRDGRINSIENEDQVTDLIRKYNSTSKLLNEQGLEIYVPSARDWYDFSIQSKNGVEHFFTPVNIKISAFSSADNCSSKTGVYYTLTGMLPMSHGISNGMQWEPYFRLLDENMGKNKERDYYYLVVNKTDTTDIFYTSLKTINKLTPNANNLPFQCKWNDNRVQVSRNYDEAKNYILSVFKDSIYKDEKRMLFDKHILKHLKGYNKNNG